MHQPDVVIVGAGMQGATMALAAARSGLTPLVVERGKVGSGATGNSYGIIHGGLRYLQGLSIGRWRRSRQAQAWFLDNYPDHVRPLACAMPLYRHTMRSPMAFRAASALEACLYRGTGLARRLPGLQLLGAEEIARAYDLPRRHLVGAALWHDLVTDDMETLLRTILADAGASGASLLEETVAGDLIVADNRIAGLKVTRADGTVQEIATPRVAICAGSWSSRWPQEPQAASTAALAFNLVLDMPFPGDAALAVSETPGKGRSYFLRPYEGGTFAGTYYRPAPGAREPEVMPADIDAFLEVLDRALPGYGIAEAGVRAVMPGLLPDTDGTGRTLSAADTISAPGPAGLCHVLGSKLTTAPLLSIDAAQRLWPEEARRAA
ncbi:FAD-dependent oxidoreductase [Novosphingobium mathurense]|nr:FAD-dependent oxidoreductase [Novosphingobium mathurense]